MNSVGLREVLEDFIQAHPDDKYNFVCMTFKDHTFAVDANKSKFME